MDFSSITSMNMHLKNIGMQQKWQKKMQEGAFSSKEKTSTDSEEERLLRIMEEQKPDQTMQSIHTKLAAGKKLTSAEMKYLQENDPVTYQKAKELDMTRKQYAQELRHCKTKEEAQRVKLKYAAQALETVNSVNSNPNIDKGQKLKLIMAENQKMNAVENITNQFVKDGHYAKLPTEAEKLKAEKEKQEALEAERNKRNDTSALQNTEQKQPHQAEPTVKDSPAEDEQQAAAQKEALAAGEAGITRKADGSSGTSKRTPKETATCQDAPTRAEAEYSPEARKVRRAKANAANTHYSGNNTAEPAVLLSNSFGLFNSKA